MSDFALTQGTSTALQQSSAASDKTKLVGDFDTFLKLLTTQLKNQTPTDPLDVNEFTQQLVQYSTVEQQIQSNDHLEGIMASLTAANLASLVSYIGNNVTASGDVTQLSNGKASWNYKASGDASEAVVRISDASGNVVYNKLTSLKSGAGTFTWDGRDDSGALKSPGFYSIQINAQNSGNPVVVNTSSLEGTVTQVDTSGSQPALTVNGVTVPLSAISSIKSPS